MDREGEMYKSDVDDDLDSVKDEEKAGQEFWDGQRIGEKVVFGPNSIEFGQDMGFHKGVPVDIVFTIDKLVGANRYKLIAPGYGGVPYGNGAIYVSVKDVPIHAVKEKKIDKDVLYEAFTAGARWGAWNNSSMKHDGIKLDIPSFDEWYLKYSAAIDCKD